MRKFSNKKLAAVAVAAVALTGTGVAYAYWTSGGSGTGSATVGTDTDNLTITATPDAGEPVLIPGGAANELQLSVSNPNTYGAVLTGQTLAFVSGTLTCQLPATPSPTDTDPAPVAVPDSWFSVSDGSVGTVEEALARHNATTPRVSVLEDSGVSIVMNNVSEDQDRCKLAKVAFSLTVADPTPAT